MKKTIIFALVASVALARAGDQPTMAALESRFADRIIALSASTNVPPHMMEQEILKAAVAVFSNHTEIVSQETDMRLAELPSFKPSDIPLVASGQEFDLSVLSVPQQRLRPYREPLRGSRPGKAGVGHERRNKRHLPSLH